MTSTVAAIWNALNKGQPLFTSAGSTARSSVGLIVLKDWLTSESAQLITPDWRVILTAYQEGRYGDTLKLLDKQEQTDLSVLILEVVCLLHLDEQGEKFKRYLALNYLRDNVLPKLRQAGLSDKTGRISTQIDWLERFSQGYELNISDLEGG